jgi:hypothetical protein
MLGKDRRFALAFAVIGLVVAITGVWVTATGGAGGIGGDARWGVLMYFTIWTNIAAAVVFAVWIFQFARRRRSTTFENQPPTKVNNYPSVLVRWTMYVAASLLLVMLAFWTLFVPVLDIPLWTYSNLTTHLVTPLLLTVFWFLCVPPGRLRRKDVWLALIIPGVYLVFTYVAYGLGYVYFVDGQSQDVRFPYFFLDYPQLGWPLVAVFIIAIAALVAGTAALFRLVDRRRARSSKHANIRNSNTS